MEVSELKELLEIAKSFGIKKLKLGELEAEFFKDTSLSESDFMKESVQFDKEPILSEEEMLFYSSELESKDPS